MHELNLSKSCVTLLWINCPPFKQWTQNPSKSHTATDEGNGKHSTFTITLQYNLFHKQIVWAPSGLPQCIQINIGLPMRKGYVILWNFPWNLCRASKITRKLSDKKNFPLLQGFVLVEKRDKHKNLALITWDERVDWPPKTDSKLTFGAMAENQSL